jgi:chromate reductase, NAD(P)H dehydrogenase (quinone)
MAAPKILVIPGSLRAKSYNVRLAALATKELMLADADVTRISLLDYPLPIYDADTAETQSIVFLISGVIEALYSGLAMNTP